MKREFFKPEMKISTFSLEDVVTTSAVGVTDFSATSISKDEYDKTSTKAVLDYALVF